MFYIVQAGTSLQILDTTGAVSQTLTLPSGVSIASTVRGHFAALGQQLVFVKGGTVNLWINPLEFTVRPLSILPPITAPLVAAGSGTGLTGAYRVKISFIVKDDAGVTRQESPLGPPSAPVTLANQSLALTQIPKSRDTGVTGRRIYRTVAGGAIYFQALDIDDNASTGIAISMSDAALALLPSDPELGNPPGSVPGTALEMVVAWGNRLWGRSSLIDDVDKLLFTDLDSFYSWASTNFLLAKPKGEDQYGITGLIPRRDELLIGKRARIMKVVGKDESDFDVITVAEGIGILSSDSVVVIRDVGYFQGLDGVYQVGPNGVQSISRDKVDPWFQTDRYFNRALFSNSIGGYNAVTDTYDLHLAAAGSTVLDRWVSFDVRRKEWLGPHKTGAFTPTARAGLQDAAGNPFPVIGSAAGKLWKMNQTGASDGGTAIAIDWIAKFLNGQEPDMFHWFGQLSVFNKRQGPTAGPITITPTRDQIDADLPATDPIMLVAQTRDRTVTDAAGEARALQLEFTHTTDAEDVELRGVEVPFTEIGKRTL